MGFWSWLRGTGTKGTEQDLSAGPYGSLAPFLDVYGSNKSKSGQTITWQTALQVSVVAGIVRVLCDGVAQVPLKLYRARPDGKGADIETEHPLARVLYRRPNPWQTSYTFRETMMLHLVLCGNFFALKNMIAGQVRELIPIEPQRVEAEQQRDLSVRYWVRNDDGQKREVPEASIFHVRGPSWNSWMGMEAIKIAREAIGLTMSIEADQADMYKHGLRTTGTYSVEGTLNASQYESLRKFIVEHQAERGGPLILDRSAKYLQQSLSGVDAQTLESRAFQVEETCRPFRVMPIMVGHSDKTATYASAEQMFLAHVVHTLCPWYERLQQEFDVQLLDPDRDADLYTKFVVNGLLRGAFETRMNGYAKALGSGGAPPFMEVNEIRALEDMNPVDWGDGKPEPPQAKPADPAKAPVQ